MTASTLIELDTTAPAITFADDLIDDALPFTLTETGITAAEIISTDPFVPLTVLGAAIQLPPGHGGATIRVHLRDDVANETIVDHVIASLTRMHAKYTSHPLTAGTLQATRAVTKAVARDKARTAGHGADVAHVKATQRDDVSPS